MHLRDARWVVVPEAEGQAISSAEMLVLQVGRIAPQRMNVFMIDGFLDMWKKFWHEILYNAELLLKSCGTYRSIRGNPSLLLFQGGFPSPNNQHIVQISIYMETKKDY